jgi:hypothetical protein
MSWRRFNAEVIVAESNNGDSIITLCLIFAGTIGLPVSFRNAFQLDVKISQKYRTGFQAKPP